VEGIFEPKCRVAIQTTFQRLEESVTLPPETDYGLLGPVEYFDFDNHSMVGRTGCTAKPGFAKQKSFEYEKEVRAMVHIPPPLEKSQIKSGIKFTERHLDK